MDSSTIPLGGATVANGQEARFVEALHTRIDELHKQFTGLEHQVELLCHQVKLLKERI